jgi:hypothetical protein
VTSEHPITLGSGVKVAADVDTLASITNEPSESWNDFDEFVKAPADPLCDMDYSSDDEAESSVRKRPLSPMPSENKDESNKKTRFDTVYCFKPSRYGTQVHAVYLVNSNRKRTVIVDAEEGLAMPAMREAMDKEIASFRLLNCIEDVYMSQVPRGSNLVTTRWVFAVKTKEDGSKK